MRPVRRKPTDPAKTQHSKEKVTTRVNLQSNECKIICAENETVTANVIAIGFSTRRPFV